MMIFGLLAMLSPLLGLLLIVWAIITIVQAVTKPKRMPEWAACEKCRYAVANLSTFTCPECGTDFRRTGIITPAMEARRRGSTLTALIAWTFLCGTCGYIVAMIAMMTLSVGTMMATTAPNTWTNTLSPNTGIYQDVTLTYDTDFLSLTSNMDIVLTLNDGAEHTLVLDPVQMQVSGLNNGPAAWNGSVIDALFTQAGLDVTDPNISAAASEVGRIVDVTIMSPSSAYGMNTTEHTSMPSSSGTGTTTAMTSTLFDGAGVVLAIIGVGLVIYVGGVVWIVVRRRAMQRLTEESLVGAPAHSST